VSDPANKTTHAQRRRMEARDGARLKLKAGQFVRRLREIADKAESVEPTQVPALRLKADIYCRLLAKCLPDLKSIEHSGDLTHRHVHELSDEDLTAIATGGRTGTTDETTGEAESSGVHRVHQAALDGREDSPDAL